jgi:hypothetical protein
LFNALISARHSTKTQIGREELHTYKGLRRTGGAATSAILSRRSSDASRPASVTRADFLDNDLPDVQQLASPPSVRQLDHSTGSVQYAAI